MIIKDGEYADIPTPTGPMRLHLFRPAAAGRYPGILLYSEIYQITGPISASRGSGCTAPAYLSALLTANWPPEDRSHCRIAIISYHPPLDLSRLERGQPHRQFSV